MKFLTLILGILIIGGCAVNNVNPDFQLGTGKNNTGLVVGSVSQSDGGASGGAYGIFYLEGSKKELVKTMIKTRTEKLAGLHIYKSSEFQGEEGRLFAIELPEGDYAFTSWQLVNGTGARIFPKKDPEPLKFFVKNGEITYVGNLFLDITRGKNGFGIEISAGAIPSVKDKFDRDSAVFRASYPKLSNQEIKKTLLKQGNWFTEETSKTIDPIPVSQPLPSLR